MAQLDEQLIEQARHLALRDPTKPQQANLRRAVSAAYYSLFHFLVDHATRSLVGTQDEALRHLLTRAFTHADMKEAAKQFASGNTKNLPGSVREVLGASAIPSPLQQIARTFVDAQERRENVLTIIDRIDNARMSWHAFTQQDQSTARIFLLSILLWNRVKRR